MTSEDLEALQIVRTAVVVAAGKGVFYDALTDRILASAQRVTEMITREMETQAKI